MAKLARDLMQTDVVSVSPNTPLTDVSRLFVEDGLNGAPVVDEQQRLVGVISSIDLLRAVEEEHHSPANDPTYFREVLEFSGPDWASAGDDFQDRLSQLRVADVMQASIVTVAEDTPVHEVAKTLRAHRIHRVLVMKAERLVGVLSTFDLVSLLEEG